MNAVRVVFETDSGVRELQGDVGTSLMSLARRCDVDGIVAECGGSAVCGTCHVHVDETWIDRAGAPEEIENAVLELVKDRRPTSRLACQINLSAELDGLRVKVADNS